MYICVYVVYHPSHAFPLSGFWPPYKNRGGRPGQLSLRKTTISTLADKEGKGLNKLEAVSVQVVDREGEEAEQGSQ